MHALALLLAATVAAPSGTDAPPRAPENLLAGPARCVLRYLDAVRRAGPRAPSVARGRLPDVRARDYEGAMALVAPRTLQEIARRTAAGEDHPLAAWREASRARVLESFQLVSVRRAPRGAAVVTVVERLWEPPAAELGRQVSEYLVGRVGGTWRIVDRREGAAFDDAAVDSGYAGFFDAPPGTR
ncbi:MAG TPA: hypothetical protein VFL83_15810 [Anaeromyxobacter sp.]|nr:hypothetical protein [Anaeromyxobacter sp.]